jgi:hypothetical protein
MEHRNFNDRELLTWNRFLVSVLLGIAVAYGRERGGGVDDFVEFASARLAQAWEGLGGRGVEPAALGLLLNIESLGGDVQSRQAGPESAEIVTGSLPGQVVSNGLSEWFEVNLSSAQIRALAGVTEDEMNGLLDVLAGVADAAGVEAQREPEGNAQRITLRAW